MRAKALTKDNSAWRPWSGKQKAEDTAKLTETNGCSKGKRGDANNYLKISWVFGRNLNYSGYRVVFMQEHLSLKAFISFSHNN